jgi:putative toxin-antitoxin system antitoxin component (TIGR02293 family)
MENDNILMDPAVPYVSLGSRNFYSFIEMVRQGIDFSIFRALVGKSKFSLSEWSSFLHISDRTMQRYQKEQRPFDALQSEKIIEIALLFKKGKDVFGTDEKFNTWLDTTNIALGGVKPKSLMDSSFGIQIISDELSHIEHGLLS